MCTNTYTYIPLPNKKYFYVKHTVNIVVYFPCFFFPLKKYPRDYSMAIYKNLPQSFLYIHNNPPRDISDFISSIHRDKMWVVFQVSVITNKAIINILYMCLYVFLLINLKERLLEVE